MCINDIYVCVCGPYIYIKYKEKWKIKKSKEKSDTICRFLPYFYKTYVVATSVLLINNPSQVHTKVHMEK